MMSNSIGINYQTTCSYQTLMEFQTSICIPSKYCSKGTWNIHENTRVVHKLCLQVHSMYVWKLTLDNLENWLKNGHLGSKNVVSFESKIICLIYSNIETLQLLPPTGSRDPARYCHTYTKGIFLCYCWEIWANIEKNRRDAF